MVGCVALLSVALFGAGATTLRAAKPDGEEAPHNRSWAVVSGPALDIRFEPLTRADGIPLDRSYQVLQDRLGFIWFTTMEGLVRHDGYQHIRFVGMPLIGSPYTANRLPGMLFEDRKGTLWVATDVLTKFEPNRGEFTTVLNPRGGPARPGIDVITAIHDGPRGSLWIGVSSHNQSTEISEPVLYELNPENGVSVQHKIDASITGGQAVGIRAIEQDKRGRLWLGTSIGLVRFDPDTNSFRHYPHAHTTKYWPQKAFSGLVWDKAGHLWIRLPDGIERFDPEAEVFDRFIATRLWNMTSDADGRLWLWGGSAGLEVFDPASPAGSALKSVSYRTPGSPFEELAIPMLGCDRQGNVWVFLHPHFALYRYSPRVAKLGKHVATLNEPNSLYGGMVAGFAENKNGSVSIATNRGLNLFDPRTGAFTHFKHDSRAPNSLPSDHILSVYEDKSNTVWIATDGDLLGRFDTASGRYRPLRLSQWSMWAIQSMFEDSRGRFWVGDQMGTVRLVDRQTGAVSQEFKGHIAYEDRVGNLWFGAPPGLHKLDRAGRLRSIPLLKSDSANPLSHPIVRSIHEDASGALWLATTSGLFRFDPSSEQATRFTPADGLASSNLSCLLSDDDGNLWISTDRGISRFDPQAGRFFNYDERDGLQGNRFLPRACLRARDGRLYFGGNLGFNTFYPRDVLALPEESKVIVTSLQIKDRPAPVFGIGSLQLNHRQNGLTFEFAVPNAPSPWKLRYRFRLEGLERRWVEVDSAHRLARYTDVPPGEYVFRAEASTDGQSWSSQGTTLSFTIVPPWWRTSWAYTLAVLLTLALLAVSYWLRVGALYRHQKQLKTLVDERTAELAMARDQAEAANRAKSAFLANMSHEFRTPLNAILGFSNLLLKGSVNGDQREQVNVINRSGEHLLTLINDVLDVAKIEAGKQTLALAPCDLASLVQDVIDMMRIRARAKNVELLCVHPPDCPRFLLADAPKLRQILINLLSNAVKFTVEGTVSLRFSTASPDQHRVRLRFEVEDTGIGIPFEDQARIFEPFVQGGQSGLQKGTGLGLTITRRFVEMMGGTIELESVPGRGTRFTVDVPMELAQEAEATRAQGDQEHRFILEPGQSERRVLIVEDNPENATVLEQMLLQAGFQVRVARNGALGVEQFQQWRPHFIWMDVRMPDMDGMEATRRIRELDGGREVKIAAMTASAFQSERAVVMASGMDDFIGKPYRWEQVFECMAQHLGVKYHHGPLARTGKEEDPGLLRPAALATLPSQLRGDLKDAVILLDQERIRSVIDRVRQVDEVLAFALSRLADGLGYTAILNAIENSEREEAPKRQLSAAEARPDPNIR